MYLDMDIVVRGSIKLWYFTQAAVNNHVLVSLWPSQSFLVPATIPTMWNLRPDTPNAHFFLCDAKYNRKRNPLMENKVLLPVW